MKIRDKLIHFSEGTGQNFGKVENKVLSLGDFWRMLRDPVETRETLSKYLRLPDQEQIRLKAVNGFIYRTQVDGKKRNRKSGRPSDLITLDFDYATPELFEKFVNREVCSDIYWIMHTSRRHTPENPRFRVFIPLKTPLPNDSYPAVSRIVGQFFDPSMVHLDKVSFRPAQMMFKPTCSADAEYTSLRNEGDLLDWEDEVEVWAEDNGDWRDIDNWPRAVGDNLRQMAEKAEDPTTKKGIVGDFCRAYSIEEAIEKFLPDVYEPVDGHWAKPRYTYLGGTTSNGAEVQDDGLFLYSHHGSDPCSEMLVNAFDMVRLHLFGKDDDGIDEDKAKSLGPSKMPSFKSMKEFVLEDPKFRKAQVESNYDMLAIFDDAGLEADDGDEDDERDATPKNDMRAKARDFHEKKRKKLDYDPLWFLDYEPPVIGERRKKPGKKWHTKLELDQNGNIVPNLPNIARILQNDPRFSECIEYNEQIGKIVMRVPLRTRSDLTTIYYPKDMVRGDRWNDSCSSAIRLVLESENGEGKLGYGLKVSDRDLESAIRIAGETLPFHPVKDMILRDEHDGKRRAEYLFIDYLGTPDTAYYREAAKLFLLAIVARTFEPGMKFDYCPVLSGPQGIRKSSFLEALSGGFFAELTADLTDEKAVVENIQHAAVVEIGELSAMRRSVIETQKQFLTRTESVIREAYGRHSQVFKRQCVFAGTTNQETYLQDLTGNRRFWPIDVQVDEIDTEKLKRNLGQIYAEVFNLYVEMREKQPLGNLPLFLSKDATDEVEVLQASKVERTEVHYMAEKIEFYLMNPRTADRFAGEDEIGDTPDYLRDDEIWQDILEETRRPSKMDIKHMGDAMRLLGWWKRHNRRFGTSVVKVWAPFRDDVQRRNEATGGARITGNEWRDLRSPKTEKREKTGRKKLI